ncbi:c-type cytochrome [Undibacter mobilis]|uniref:c-type cytochrome n=1 Tax=Undibacter mobilis TaxID=2292256 RepID=UPI00143D7560|nr:cytochrome c [Undibacter mobilis]
MAAGIAIAALAASAHAQEPAVRGRALLKDNCAACHAIDRLDRSARPAAPPFRVLGESFDLDQFARRLRQGLASSHPDMPEFRFSADDADAVVAYLRTIQQ